jgi:hypothetical protein
MVSEVSRLLICHGPLLLGAFFLFKKTSWQFPRAVENPSNVLLDGESKDVKSCQKLKALNLAFVRLHVKFRVQVRG